MDIKIIKKIGEGFNGTVFLIEFNGEKMIYKIEKLNDFDQGLKSIYYRQIDFNENVACHYPNRFMVLKSYGIIENCKHKQQIPANVKGKWKKMLIEKNNLPRCCYLIYSPVLDGTFMSIKKKVFKSINLYYDMFYQVVDGLNIMRNAGYTHQDLHSNNIMFSGKTKLKWYIIDYGGIGNKKYPVSKDDIKRKEYISLDLIVFLWNCAIDNSAEDYANKNGIKKVKYPIFLKRLKALPEYKELLKYLPKTNNKIIINDCLSLLLCIFYYEKFKKCLGFVESKWDKFKLNVPDLELVLYCIKHCEDKNYLSILKKFNRN